jgi:hypothetical protein
MKQDGLNMQTCIISGRWVLGALAASVAALTGYATLCSKSGDANCQNVYAGKEVMCILDCPLAVLCKIQCNWTVEATPTKPWVFWVEEPGGWNFDTKPYQCTVQCEHQRHRCGMHRRWSYQDCVYEGSSEVSAHPKDEGCPNSK